MKNILIDLLESLSVSEFSRFIRFVESSFFNTDKSVLTLLYTLDKKILEKRTFDEAAQKEVYEYVFLKKKESLKTFTKKQKAMLGAKMGLLTKLVKQYLIIIALEENSACEKELLYSKLLEKKQFNVMSRQLNKDKKNIEATRVKGIKTYNYAFRVEEGLLDFYYQNGRLMDEDNIDELVSYLDINYLLNKLSLQLAALSMSRVYAKKKFNIDSISAIDDLLNIEAYSAIPLVKVYSVAVDLMKTNTSEDYQRLLHLLDVYQTEIPHKNLVDFYVVAVNFCLYHLRKGKLEYNRKLFELYKRQDEKNLLLEGNLLPISKFRNLVGISCRLGEFEWALTFIEKYESFIHKPVRESVCNHGYGLVAFHKGDYKKAISYLIRVKSGNLSYDNNGRILLYKSYYEMDKDYDERSVQMFRSAKKYFGENKAMATSHKKGIQNFVRLLINLYRFQHQEGKIRLERIQEKLDNFDYISEKQWLQDKIDELQKKK